MIMVSRYRKNLRKEFHFLVIPRWSVNLPNRTRNLLDGARSVQSESAFNQPILSVPTLLDTGFVDRFSETSCARAG